MNIKHKALSDQAIGQDVHDSDSASIEALRPSFPRHSHRAWIFLSSLGFDPHSVNFNAMRIIDYAYKIAARYHAEQVTVHHLLSALAADHIGQDLLTLAGVDCNQLMRAILPTSEPAIGEAAAGEIFYSDEASAIVHAAASRAHQQQRSLSVSGIIFALEQDSEVRALYKEALFPKPISRHYLFLQNEMDLYTDDDLVERYD